MNMASGILIFTAFAVLLIFALTPSGSLSERKAERKAEEAICQGMASDVLAGAASKFEYMSTRCPAALLVKEQVN